MDTPLVVCPACGRCRQTQQHVAQCSGSFTPAESWTPAQALAICAAIGAAQEGGKSTGATT